MEPRSPSTRPPEALYISLGIRDRGGIGRRASLRSWWGNPWGFESLRSHSKTKRGHAKTRQQTHRGPQPCSLPDNPPPYAYWLDYFVTCLTFWSRRLVPNPVRRRLR